MPVFKTKDFQTKLHKQVYNNKRDLLCMYWNHNAQDDCHLLNQDKQLFMKVDVKSWKKTYKNKKLQILEHNNCENECKINGRKFYGMTLQFLDDEGEVARIDDPFSILVMGRIVTGLTYWFPIKKNRDIIYNWITK